MTSGRKPGSHKKEYLNAQRDAKEILRQIKARENTAGQIAKDYKCSPDTLRRAVVSVVGKERWYKVIRANLVLHGFKMGKSQGRIEDGDKHARKALKKLRTTNVWYECFKCGNDMELPAKCPKCGGLSFVLRRRPLATAFHQEK